MNSVLSPPSPSPSAERLTVAVRPPCPAELRACRMLLPEAFRRGVTPDLLLAVTDRPTRFAGAASYRPVSVGGELGWDVSLHVATAHRRRGVGTRLMQRLAEAGRASAVRAIVAGHDVDREQGAAAFLRSLGFRSGIRISNCRVQLEDYVRAFEPIRERLIARGKVPASVRAVALHEVPRDAVLRFHAEQMRRLPTDVELPWPETWDRKPMREGSMVLLDGEDVIGLGLGERNGPDLFAHYRLVHPDHRGGWAGLIQAAEGARWMYARGVRHVDFTSTTRTPDTESLINLYGAVRVSIVDRYCLPLDVTAGHARNGESSHA